MFREVGTTELTYTKLAGGERRYAIQPFCEKIINVKELYYGLYKHRWQSVHCFDICQNNCRKYCIKCSFYLEVGKQCSSYSSVGILTFAFFPIYFAIMLAPSLKRRVKFCPPFCFQFLLMANAIRKMFRTETQMKQNAKAEFSVTYINYLPQPWASANDQPAVL